MLISSSWQRKTRKQRPTPNHQLRPLPVRARYPIYSLPPDWHGRGFLYKVNPTQSRLWFSVCLSFVSQHQPSQTTAWSSHWQDTQRRCPRSSSALVESGSPAHVSPLSVTPETGQFVTVCVVLCIFFSLLLLLFKCKHDEPAAACAQVNVTQALTDKHPSI